MTERQGKFFVATFMAVTLGMIVAGPILAYWFNDGNWMWMCIALIFYLS
jgi:hypothetical protein